MVDTSLIKKLGIKPKQRVETRHANIHRRGLVSVTLQAKV